MQLNLSETGQESRPDILETADRVRNLAREHKEIREALEGSAKAFESGREAEVHAFELEQSRIREEHEEQDEACRGDLFEARARLEEIRETRFARIARATDGLRDSLEDELREERRLTTAEIAAAQEELKADEEKLREPMDRRLRLWEELLPVVRKHHKATEEAVVQFATRHGAALEEPDAWFGDIDIEADPETMANDAKDAMDGVVHDADRAAAGGIAGLARTGRVVFLQILLLVGGAGAAWVALRLDAQPADLIPLLVGVVVLTVMLHVSSRLVRGKYSRLANSLLKTTRNTGQEFRRHAEASVKHLEARHIQSAEAHARRLMQAEQEVRRRRAQGTSDARRRLDRLNGRRKRAQIRAGARHEERILAAETGDESKKRQMRLAHEKEMSDLTEGHRDRMNALEAEHVALTRRLRERRETSLEEFNRFAASIQISVARGTLPWGEIDVERIELPREFPGFVPLGRLKLPADAILGPSEDGAAVPDAYDLPVAATFPEHGSILVRHSPEDRFRAIDILSNVVLRALAGFPAGKVRLTIIDPVGLGQSFSALMHLADHDEELVNSRIWTETSHIERRLADLTEHIEKVIQKYLRNRYDTIEEYNAEAGELQEPYHFLVIADFPAAFNDLAAERLASIVASGPRCGVYTLIAHDIRQPAPPPVDLGLLRRNGPAVIIDGNGCRMEGEGLDRGEFLPESPPSADVTRLLLDRIGVKSLEAANIELPFHAAAPEEGKLWSATTLKDVSVPIGRTGAERLQYMNLGRGTAQHALIAGRTGSGKSTLFHVMITNMSLWFSPAEIEFYLIDFKKGVEFKPFATHGLPHARVVAIESDREFGLSVLRAVDAELARRGDLFRARGVQDIASYRRGGGEEVLPRTMLMIDEFQEFFTDDDAVAHDAALLLDRFVRQGRAFGIHVVLGSQTLSGIYSLARGTLGQMGVRIALQCNESDSYLILSEDNGVARLLSRPGEAIYNDKSGLVEGNNPFQVVWLPEAEEQRQLERIRNHAAEVDLPPLPKTVVFEGNQPAEIEENPELMALIDGVLIPADGDDQVWLGEPNAIKGPTEVRFLEASGSNLLIVGQRRDAAFSMMAAAIFSLAAQHEPGSMRIVILDGGGHEPDFAAHFDDLMETSPLKIERYDIRTTPDAVAELAEAVNSRQAGIDEGPPIYVFVFGLQRLRMLRQEDEFAMSFGEDKQESSGERFSTILTEGPPQRVHSFIWCDTVTNLQRAVSRRMMREFDMRVLFQMSAADSSELIESSAANRLGLSSAMLAVESAGTFEKFRPYAIPSAETMRRLAGEDPD